MEKLTKEDLSLIEGLQIAKSDVEDQIDRFKKGFESVQLISSAIFFPQNLYKFGLVLVIAHLVPISKR